MERRQPWASQRSNGPCTLFTHICDYFADCYSAQVAELWRNSPENPNLGKEPKARKPREKKAKESKEKKPKAKKAAADEEEKEESDE